MRELLAANIERLMADTPGMDTPEKLAKFCRWPTGHKKAGKKIAPRTIRYLLDTRKDAPSPSLDMVAAIAAAFGRPPWELLTDDEQTRHYLVSRILSAPPVPTERLPLKLQGAAKTGREVNKG